MYLASVGRDDASKFVNNVNRYGEWSKKVGEEGEAVAGRFLRLVGWGAAQQGVEFPCARPEAHKRGDSGRKTHGIDYLLACKIAAERRGRAESGGIGKIFC